MKTRTTSLHGKIAGEWNLLFCNLSTKIRTIKRQIRQNLSQSNSGKGSKAWKRYEKMIAGTETNCGYRLV